MPKKLRKCQLNFSEKILQNWQNMWENMSSHLISPFTPKNVQKCHKNLEKAKNLKFMQKIRQFKKKSQFSKTSVKIDLPMVKT